MASRIGARALEGSSQVSVNLKGLSRTVLPSDLRRLCGKSGIENVAVVAVNYSRFRHNGSAILSFTRPEFVPAAVKALDRSVLGGKAIRAEATDDIPVLARTRGSKGVLEAAQRGVHKGNGPAAGLLGGGKTVVLTGLPDKLAPTMVADNLRNFKLARTETGSPAVIKVWTNQKLSSTSRFIVRLASVSEAYRLVRTLHMQKWRSDLYNDKFVVRASVVS